MIIPHHRLRRPLLTLLCLVCTLAGALTGCSPGGDRVSAGSTSVQLPEGFVEVTEGPMLEGGWDAAYTDSVDDPHALLRLSDDLGRAPAADTTFSTLRGEALFQQSYGEDFTITRRSDIDIRRADRALEVRFTYTTEQGDAMTGYWWLFSSTSTGTTAAVELSGDEITDDAAEAVRSSIRYAP